MKNGLSRKEAEAMVRWIWDMEMLEEIMFLKLITYGSPQNFTSGINVL